MMTIETKHVLAGIVGGIVGSTAMVAFNELLAGVGFAKEDVGRHDQRRHVDGKPNDTDGTIADEPASIKATAGAAERLTGHRLPEPGRRALGMLGHHGFGAVVGGVYGMIASRRPVVTRGAGLPYGACVWFFAAEVGMPAAGLARPPGTYPASRHLASLGSHLVFGLTLAAIHRTLARECS